MGLGRTMQDLILGSAPAHATLAQPAAGADSLKDLRARRAQDHACLAVYILKVYILKMTLLGIPSTCRAYR